MDRLKAVLTEVRHTPQGLLLRRRSLSWIKPFVPMRLLGDTDSLSEVQTLSYVSGSKFPVEVDAQVDM